MGRWIVDWFLVEICGAFHPGMARMVVFSAWWIGGLVHVVGHGRGMATLEWAMGAMLEGRGGPGLGPWAQDLPVNYGLDIIEALESTWFTSCFMHHESCL